MANETEVELSPDSRLFLYTDGLTEAINSSLEEYGANRMMQHVTSQTATIQSPMTSLWL